MNHLVLKGKFEGKTVFFQISDLTAFVQADSDSDCVGENEQGEVEWCRKGDLTELEVSENWSLSR